MIRPLVRAAAAFVGVPVPSGAERASLESQLGRMISALAPRERRLLRAGLGVLDVAALVRRLRPFAALDDATARAVLDALARSPVAALRRLHLSVRMMTQLAWYADPAHWGECDYDGPWIGRIEVERGAPPDLGPAA